MCTSFEGGIQKWATQFGLSINFQSTFQTSPNPLVITQMLQQVQANARSMEHYRGLCVVNLYIIGSGISKLPGVLISNVKIFLNMCNL